MAEDFRDVMKVLAKCPQCKRTTQFDEQSPDRRMKCAWCGRMFKIPAWEELADAARIIKTQDGAIYIDENGRLYG
jgi:ribosomal protein L37AE/L43A